ncbi:MAG: hypothetical protein AAF234_06550 [Pseudomonadota bacterium]
MSSLYDFAKKVGQGGGTIDTTGRTTAETQTINQGVNDGKAGK